jgi:hypothetical protein
MVGSAPRASVGSAPRSASRLKPLFFFATPAFFAGFFGAGLFARRGALVGMVCSFGGEDTEEPRDAAQEIVAA